MFHISCGSGGNGRVGYVMTFSDAFAVFLTLFFAGGFSALFQ